MTQLSRGGRTRPVTVSCLPSVQPHPLSRAALAGQIALRRARLTDNEAAMIAACEAAALGARSRSTASADPPHWNRAIGHRYLAAAMRLRRRAEPRGSARPGFVRRSRRPPTRAADDIADRRLIARHGSLMDPLSCRWCAQAAKAPWVAHLRKAHQAVITRQGGSGSSCRHRCLSRSRRGRDDQLIPCASHRHRLVRH
jgi:hypothetical protein